jgi:ATP-dependent helicase/nuclease subunit A
MTAEFTAQQKRAIGARNVSVALAAGADCGKTFVLTERFLACLDPERPGGPLRLDQLTAITFTERAAREMRERIRKTCLERLRSAAEKHVQHWLRILRDLDTARISTIHAFCGALLRAHAVEARLDPRFQVLDATATQTVLFELIDEQLRERLAQSDETVIDLVVKFGLDGLREMAGRLLHERQQIDWDAWQKETPEQLVARWEKFWREVALPRVLHQVKDSPAAATILDVLGREMPSHAVMRERCAALRDRLPRLKEATDAAAALEELRGATIVQGGGGKKSWSSEETYQEFAAAAKTLLATIDKVAKQAAFDLTGSLPAAKDALALLDVVRGLSEAYQRRKKELAALDFDDLLIAARDLLTGPAAAELRRRLASQAKLLMVDEFQDTDPIQVELVRALCDGRVADGKLFFVGDYKQSIYRFRGADPHVFRRLRDEIPEAGQLPLTRNFRSQPSVIEFVNSLFAREMGPEYEPLEAHRPQFGQGPKVEFMWAVEPDAGKPDAANDGADDEGSRAKRNRRREARWIARRIRAMLDSGEELIGERDAEGKPALRAVRPGDIALLFRALTNVEYYEEALRDHGIDYYLVGGRAFYAQQEIFDIVNLLRAVASPCDEVALAGVLRSPMFHILDETLYVLARHERGLSGGFWSAPEGAGIAPDELARVRFAAETLAELRAEKDRVPIAELIHKALERTGYDAMLLAEFLGERKLANLHKLIEQARQFNAAGIFTLADFIVQLSQFVARQPDEPLAATQPESINEVRLMSIHQSKGLEFPVVVVVDLDRQHRAVGEGVAFTPELGPMVRLPKCMSGYDLFKQEEREEEFAELTRLLYVATTRAGDYLVLSSGLQDLDQPRGPWLEMLQRQFDLRTGMPLSSPGAAPPRPLAKVILEEPPLPKKAGKRPKRIDVRKTIAAARELAAAGKGEVPSLLRPVPVDRRARRQYSISRLNGTIRRQVHAPHDFTDDNAAPGAALDPLGLGSLVHAVLADLAGGKDDSSSAIASLVRKHACVHLPSAGNDLTEPLGLIAGLAATPRWASLRQAKCVHAELEFLLAWPPERAAADGPFIQGFIDCLYQDPAGDWRLLDYKTNRISPESLASTIEGYEMQMLLYALAVERVLRRPPVEVVLHFLRGNVEHQFVWDDAARRRALELVDAALESSQHAEVPALADDNAIA